jgi:GTPase SAR1 family protein
LGDARALASPQLTVLLAGNKADLSEDNPQMDDNADLDYVDHPSSNAPNRSSEAFSTSVPASISSTTSRFGLGSQQKATVRDPTDATSLVPQSIAQEWASSHNIPVCVEVSALSGDGVDELFSRLARMILAKIEIGEIDPGDPSSGIQYGDSGWWGDTGSTRSGVSLGSDRKRRSRKRGCC